MSKPITIHASDLIPLSTTAQAEIKGGARMSCEEKRRPIRRPK